MQWNAPLKSDCLCMWLGLFLPRPNRLCTGKTTPSLTLLAKCAYLETTHWLTSRGWKRTQHTTSLWQLSIQLAPGRSRRPSTPPQRNHVSPSPKGDVEIISKWHSFMNHVRLLRWRCSVLNMMGAAFFSFVGCANKIQSDKKALYLPWEKNMEKKRTVGWVECSCWGKSRCLKGMLKVMLKLN